MPDAPVLGQSKKVKLDESAFGAGFRGPLVHQSVRAEQAARRRGTAATRRVRWSPAAAPSRGVRRAPDARVPAPAARRSGRAAAWPSGPTRAPTPSRSTARSSARLCAARCRCTPSASRWRSSTRERRRAEDQPCVRPARRLGPGRPHAGRALARGGHRSLVVSQPQACGCADGDGRRRYRSPRCRLAAGLRGRAGRADGARRQVPDATRRRRRPDGPLAGDHPPGRLGEEHTCCRRFTATPSACTTSAQDADPPGCRGAVRRTRGRGPHVHGQVQAQAPRHHDRAYANVEEGHRAGARGRVHPDLQGLAAVDS